MKAKKIIILEGPDGSGKSTLIKELQSQLEHAGIPVVTAASLDTNPTSQAVRHYTTRERDQIPEEIVPLLQEASRHAVLDSLADQITPETVLILDRWALSTWVYDKHKTTLDLEAILTSQRRLERIAPTTTYVLCAEGTLLDGRMKKDKDLREDDMDLQRHIRSVYVRLSLKHTRAERTPFDESDIRSLDATYAPEVLAYRILTETNLVKAHMRYTPTLISDEDGVSRYSLAGR